MAVAKVKDKVKAKAMVKATATAMAKAMATVVVKAMDRAAMEPEQAETVEASAMQSRRRYIQ